MSSLRSSLFTNGKGGGQMKKHMYSGKHTLCGWELTKSQLVAYRGRKWRQVNFKRCLKMK